MSGLIVCPDGLTRVEPVIPVEHMTTYQVVSPQRDAFCHEVDCEYFQRGWTSTFDEGTELGRNQANYVRSRSGRRFRESRTEAGLTVFDFYPGQECFATHKLPAADERFIRRGGDWRGNPRQERRVFQRPDDWIDDFATHQDRLLVAIERG